MAGAPHSFFFDFGKVWIKRKGSLHQLVIECIRSALRFENEEPSPAPPLSRLEFWMHANVTQPGGTIVPTLRYRDVAAAIAWLLVSIGTYSGVMVWRTATKTAPKGAAPG